MNAANLLLAMTLSSGTCGQLGGMPYVGPGRDIIVATVTKYSPKTAIADLTVHGVLRGDPRQDRRQALWQAPLDISEGKLRLPITPDPVPAVVGKKYILSGDVQGQGNKQVFVLAPYWRYHYNEANLQEVRTFIIRANAAYLVDELRRLGDATMLGVRRSLWRHSTNAQIQRYAKEADFIVIGKITSEGFHGGTTVACDIKVSRVLKGQWRTTDQQKHAAVSVPRGIHHLMNRETPYLLFLSERGMLIGVSGGNYPILDDGRAVTIADADAARMAMDAVAALPPAPPRPLVLLEIQVGAYESWQRFCRVRDEFAASVDKAAEKRGTVLRTHTFSIDFGRLAEANQAFIAKHMRARVPGAKIYLAVRLDEKAEQPSRVKLTALNLETAQGAVILTREWHFKDQADMEAKVAEMMRTLIAAPK